MGGYSDVANLQSACTIWMVSLVFECHVFLEMFLFIAELLI